MLIPQGDAMFSGCGRYRYRLTRELGGKLTLTVVMLNPSTADGSADDPTIRRCKGFAKDWGYGRLVIVNLYAFRATDPREMWRMAHADRDRPHLPLGNIIGEDNDSAISRAVGEARHGMWSTPDGMLHIRNADVADVLANAKEMGIVLCAWGRGGTTDKQLLKLHTDRVERVAKLIGGDLYCLGTNKDGSPVHPLYQPEDTEAMLWRGP